MASGGLLAESPAFFEGCQHISGYTDSTSYEAYTLTNRGLQINLPVRDRFYFLRQNDRKPPSLLQARLQCYSKTDRTRVIALWIKKEADSNTYYRIGDLELVPANATFDDNRTMYFKLAPRQHGPLLNTVFVPWTRDHWIERVWPESAYDESNRTITLGTSKRVAVRFVIYSTPILVLLRDDRYDTPNALLSALSDQWSAVKKGLKLATIGLNDKHKRIQNDIQQWLDLNEYEKDDVWERLGLQSTDWKRTSSSSILPQSFLHFRLNVERMMGQRCFVLHIERAFHKENGSFCDICTNSFPADHDDDDLQPD